MTKEARISKSETATLRLLGIGHRTIRALKPANSIHFRRLRNHTAIPTTLGEHLRKKRIDLSVSLTQLAKLLGLGVTDSAVAKWEKNVDLTTEAHRRRIVEFL